jgi:hypothetical protein
MINFVPSSEPKTPEEHLPGLVYKSSPIRIQFGSFQNEVFYFVA